MSERREQQSKRPLARDDASEASPRLATSDRSEVLVLAAHNTDIHQPPIAQIAQFSLLSSTSAPLLNRNPATPEGALEAPIEDGRMSKFGCTMGRVHCGIPSRYRFYRDEDVRTGYDALNIGLTFSSPAAYALRSKRCQAPFGDGGCPEGTAACAIFSSSSHSTPTGASCVAGRTSSPSRPRSSTCSIT